MMWKRVCTYKCVCVCVSICMCWIPLVQGTETLNIPKTLEDI